MSSRIRSYLATLEERATARRFLLTFGDLLFSAGSAQIGDSEKGELVRMADFLRAHPATVAQIVGHADDRGDATANSRLAEQRAAAVRSYLVVQGIDPSRLTAVSAGEDNPHWTAARNRVAPAIVGWRYWCRNREEAVETSGGLQ